MKLFEKIRRFIRGADKAVTNAICERLDNTAEKLENFARNLDPEAFQESKMRESWEGRPKTDPETAAQPAQMSVASLEDAINQITEGMVKAGFRADEAADAIRSAISAGLKPKPWIAQLFCRHHGEWFRRQEPYYNLSGETQYKVCTKCGKKLDERFIPNFDGS